MAALAHDSRFVIEETAAILSEDALPQLGPGESAAIGLASLRNAWVLLDDKLGRRYAAQKGVKVIGVIGVALVAKRAGLVPHVKPVLESLVAAGYRISAKLFVTALRAAGEGGDDV